MAHFESDQSNLCRPAHTFPVLTTQVAPESSYMSSESHNGFGFGLQDIPWTQLAPGLREKTHQSGERRFRILELSDPFREPDWCMRAHAGYVLAGEIVVNVDGKLVTYREGDVIDLPQGVRHRHDSTVKTATLFLIENVTTMQMQ